MSVTIRTAGSDDVDLLVRLNRSVQDLHAALHPGDFKAAPDPAEVRAFFRAQLGEPGTIMAIASVSAVAAGYIWLDIALQPETAFLHARQCLVVEQIAVEPGFRRQGVGRALIGHAEATAAARAIDRIDLGIWAGNGEAEAFFAALGFATASFALRRTLRA